MKYLKQLACSIFIFITVSVHSQSVTLHKNSTEIESFPLTRIQSIHFENRNLTLNLLNHVNYSLSLNEVNKITFHPYAVGVPNYTEEKVKLYPNPATNILNVKLPQHTQSDKVYIYVCQLDGRKVYDKHISCFNDHIRINVSDWKSGIYLITVYDGEKIFTNKLIKY